MSEAKREVWVVEQDDGQPLAAYIGKRAESYARLWQDDNAFRYVPESAQPAERAGEWVSVELAPLLGVLAYLSAEIGQHHKEHHAPSRIRRAKELLEKMLPPPPQPKEKP